ISGIILILLISSYSEEYEWVPVGAFGGQEYGDDAEDGKFYDPKGIDIGFNGTIYVVDTENDRFQVFDSNFTHIETVRGSDYNGIGELDDPEGIAVKVINSNITYVYIADTKNHRIGVRLQNYSFNNETNKTEVNDSWVEFGQRCDDPVDCNYDKYHYFEAPKSIEVDAEGTVYVADTDEDRIQIIDSDFEAPSFNFSGSDSVDGELNAPEGIAIDSSGNIYVADTGNNKIRIFDPNGVQLRSFGSFGSGQKEFNEPSGIEVDDEGRIFVADRGNHRIQIFGVSGNYMTEFGTENCSTDIYYDSNISKGKFCDPNDVKVVDDKIYVADTGTHRIQVFQVPALPSANVTVDIKLRYGWNLFSIPFEP
ncbi:MAG: SMP-30/gluconolactonase/LRE family protein, partial [Candidatus Altiarchaeales archaeon]|nr:SMP-30/gluconolactonase/LRE family protein [Candidatus Altiarchaeota archaeon]MCG2782251.1 SMP-30/gluconolactonase/LRE family protein [Candidatus Altiarchaeales archaeon]